MRIASLTFMLVVLVTATSWAQSASRNYVNTRARNNSMIRPPSLSPYLELIPNNTNNLDSLTGRYQTLVRPQFELQQNLARTQQSLNNLQSSFSNLQLNTSLPAQATPLGFQNQAFPVTGHPTYYMTWSHYYPR